MSVISIDSRVRFWMMSLLEMRQEHGLQRAVEIELIGELQVRQIAFGPEIGLVLSRVCEMGSWKFDLFPRRMGIADGDTVFFGKLV